MGTNEAATLDALIGRREILHRLIAPHGGHMPAWRTLRMRRLVNLWVAAVVVLVVSICETAAQPRSNEAAARPKKIVILHSYGENFQPWDSWSREIRNELDGHSP
jgi:hypothetical protein